ncbi:MAG: hypothetical protein FJ279_06235 [Planctomycetes bacterium]|nr:hypothetical protein [Planctomycetota bacterium]
MKRFALLCLAVWLACGLRAPAEEKTSDQPSTFYKDRPVRLWPVLEYLQYRDGGTELEVLWPLFDYEAVKDKAKLTMFPLVWYADEKEKGHLFLVPLYWSGHKAQKKYLVVAPIYAELDGDQRLPKYTALLPTLFTRAEGGDDVRYHVLGPAFSWEREGQRREYAFFWRLLHGGGDGVRKFGIADFDWLFQMLHVESGANRRRTKALSLFSLPIFGYDWRTDKDQSSGGTHLFPFYWHSGRGKDAGLFHVWPVYGIKWDERQHIRTHYVAAPLFRYQKQDSPSPVLPERRELGVLDLDWFMQVFSAKWGGYQKDVKFLSLFTLPLLSHEKSAASSHSHLFPLLWRTESADAKKLDSVVFPVYWHFKRGDDSYLHIAPVWGRHSMADGYVKDFVVGTLYIHEEHKQMRAHHVVWPLVQVKTDEGFFHVHTLPFFWHTNDKAHDEETTLALPLWYSWRSGDKSLLYFAPFYGEKHDGPDVKAKAVLFPFHLRSEKGESLYEHVLPLFFRTKKPTASSVIVAPFWWDFEKGDDFTFFLAPFYLHSKDCCKHTRFYLLNLFGHSGGGCDEVETYDVLWPIFHLEEHKDKYHSSRVVPIYFNGPDYNVVFPLYWDIEGRERGNLKHYLHLFPLAGYTREFEGDDKAKVAARTYSSLLLFNLTTRKDVGVDSFNLPWPLVCYYHRGKDTRFWAVPYYSQTEGDKTFSTFFPLYFARTAKDFHGAAVLGYLPKPPDDLTAKYNVLWKLAEYEAKKNGDSDFRILHKLVRSREVGKFSELVVNPIFHKEREGDDYAYFSLLKFLYSYERKGGETTHRILHFIKF